MNKNKLKINNYPINIYRLIEVINVQFLKNKFNQQNNVKKGNAGGFYNYADSTWVLNDINNIQKRENIILLRSTMVPGSSQNFQKKYLMKIMKMFCNEKIEKSKKK